MPALDAGGPYSLEVASSEESVVINNVYIGEVWLAGGQSNMEYPLGRSAGASEVVPSCPKTRIHFYNVLCLILSVRSFLKQKTRPLGM